MSRSSRPSLSRRAGPTAGLGIISRRPNIVVVSEKSKSTPYTDFLSLLDRSGATTTIPEDELRSSDAFSIYEKVYGGTTNYFMSPVFSDARENERIYLESIIRGPAVVEGITECPKCEKTRVSKERLALRSGDEPDVFRCTCMTCGYSWSISK